MDGNLINISRDLNKIEKDLHSIDISLGKIANNIEKLVAIAGKNGVLTQNEAKNGWTCPYLDEANDKSN